MMMKMRNSQVQRGVIAQQMEQRWSCYNQSPSGRFLGMELDYLLYSNVPPQWTPVQNGGGNTTCKIFTARGVQGGQPRPLGAPPWGGGFEGSALEAKNSCKIAL